MIKTMMKFRLIFALALLFQLVAVPLQSLAAEVDTNAPSWITPINYLGLGDSLAFGISSDGLPGEGYTDYLAQSLSAKNVLQSSNKGFAYPGYTAADVLKDLKDNVTKPVVGIGQSGGNLELHQSIKDANLITISAGANDVLKYFKLDPVTEAPQIDTLGLLAAIKQVGVNYNLILQEIYKVNPNVQVYVMGYYNPFPHLSAEIQPQISQLLVGLNGSIQAGMTGTNAVFVPTADAIATNFTAHLPNPQNIHLSEAGYKVVASQFSNQLQESYKWIAKDTLTATMKNDSTVSLAWLPAVDDKAVTGYAIYNGKDKVGIVSGAVHKFDTAKLTAGKEYTFTVSAIDEAGNESVLNPMVKVLLGPVPAIFSDIEDHWSKEFVEQAVTAGIFNSHSPDGKFNPNKQMTRAQVTSIIVRSLGLKGNQAAPFEDIGNYAQETQAEIAAAYQFGIVINNNGKFNPNKPVTRAQIATMLKRSYELAKQQKYIPSDKAPYTDIANYADETQSAISLLHEFKIVDGKDGKFMPANGTTRAHAAKILVNYSAAVK